MIEKIKNAVYELLSDSLVGHGNDHIERVTKMAKRFAIEAGADLEMTMAIALLHDVDDWKLVGKENAHKLNNARRILREVGMEEKKQKIIISELECFGYRNLLQGNRPKTLEGMIASDADMCDGIGATSIIRTCIYEYSNGKPFFDRNCLPEQNVNVDNYKLCADSGVVHFFEKILKLKSLMLTDPGKKEALERHKIIVEFLKHLFIEEDAPEWIEYLDNFLQDY